MINTLDITNFLENVLFIILFHLLQNFAIRRNYHCQPNILFKNKRRLLRTSAGIIRLYELRNNTAQVLSQRLPTYSNCYFLNDSCSVRSFVNVNQVEATCQAASIGVVLYQVC